MRDKNLATKIRIGMHIVDIPNFPIKMERWKDRWFVLFNPGEGVSQEDSERNLWCFDDATGKLVWRIQACPHLRGYSGSWWAYFIRDDRLFAVSDLDPTCAVDLDTGAISWTD